MMAIDPSLTILARARDRSGAVAVEFAILAPLFFFLLFGILEIGLALLFSILLGNAADDGAEYLLRQRQSYGEITAEGLRQAVCAGLGSTPLSCNERLTIEFVNADDLTNPQSHVKYPIVNRFDKPTGGQYFLAVGYRWGFVFPTTPYTLPFSGPEAQLQSVGLAILSERVTDG